MADERVWLDVPFVEKDEAKKGGARWDPAAKRWYAPRAGTEALRRWAAAPDVPDLLPGEDRGLAQVRGLEAQAFAHLVKVTGMAGGAARQHVRDAFDVWERRSRVTWELDLGILTRAGITLAPPPGAGERARTAEETLRRERRR